MVLGYCSGLQEIIRVVSFLILAGAVRTTSLLVQTDCRLGNGFLQLLQLIKIILLVEIAFILMESFLSVEL